MPCEPITQTGAVYHRDNGAYRAQLLTYPLAFSELFGVKTFFANFFQVGHMKVEWKLCFTVSAHNDDGYH